MALRVSLFVACLPLCIAIKLFEHDHSRTRTGNQASCGDGLRVIRSTFRSESSVGVPGDYQEPERIFGASGWDKFADKGAKTVHDQKTRMEALRKVFGVLPSFFATLVPDVRWSVVSGSLLAAMRTGVVMPWDTDGDLIVDWSKFNTEAIWKKLPELYPEFAQGNSTECGGKCKVFKITEDILFGVHQLPTDFPWVGRLIDTKTGHFVEILNPHSVWDVDGPDVVGCLTLFGAPVPVSSAWFLHKEYGDKDDLGFPLTKMHASKMFECGADKVSEASAMSDPFELVIFRPCADTGDAEWKLGHVNTADCKEVDDQIPDEVRLAFRKPTKC